MEEAGGPFHSFLDNEMVAPEGGIFAKGHGGGSQVKQVVAYKRGRVGAQGRDGDCFQLATSCLLFISRGDITKWCIDGNTDAIVSLSFQRH